MSPSLDARPMASPIVFYLYSLTNAGILASEIQDHDVFARVLFKEVPLSLFEPDHLSWQIFKSDFRELEYCKLL